MKNVSTLKSNTTPSPKTPGGISKSLLTPCRRVGLSRNWKKNGPSPFRSPLSGNGEVKEERIETRKRKQSLADENIEITPETSIVNKVGDVEDIEWSVNKTPSRNFDLPRRKKSKILLCNINKPLEEIKTDTDEISKDVEEATKVDSSESKDVVSTPVRSKSKKSKKLSPKKSKDSNIIEIENDKLCDLKESISDEPKQIEQNVVSTKARSPNDLTKECIVVIQKKIFKRIVPEHSTSQTDTYTVEDKKENATSQTIFDSDSDEVPLNNLNKKDKATDEDDDFIDKKNKIKPNKELKSPKDKPKKPKISKSIVKAIIEPRSLQTPYDDDDDDFDDKKTILIRKTYEKVNKLPRAKSTGSITQRDIDELKARIEAKKKFLLAKSLNPETAELRSLIKKWQKGCQDALTELLELMRGKFPDQNMDYGEMLKTLKIPSSLVGYDSDNDCFKTPNDEDIILGKFNDS